MYDSRVDLIVRLINIRTALDKARTAQSYTNARGASTQRATLRTLLEEEKMVLAKIEAIDRASGGWANKVKFKRPA